MKPAGGHGIDDSPEFGRPADVIGNAVHVDRDGGSRRGIGKGPHRAKGGTLGDMLAPVTAARAPMPRARSRRSCPGRGDLVDHA
jgi:hypothetical protein